MCGKLCDLQRRKVSTDTGRLSWSQESEFQRHYEIGLDIDQSSVNKMSDLKNHETSVNIDRFCY